MDRHTFGNSAINQNRGVRITMNHQKEFKEKYGGLTWNSKYIGKAPKYPYLTNHKIEQTINSIESGKFSNQQFLPYESFFWWYLWINNRTELDAFGNFREKQMDVGFEITVDDAGKIWIDPASWFKKKKKRKRISNGMSKGGVIIYNKVANETQSIKDEKARINWAMVMAHGWLKAKGCFYCHATLWEVQKSKDHVLPKSRSNGFKANIVCSCRSCNGKKGDMTPSEWQEQLTYYVMNPDLTEEVKYYYHEILDTLDNMLERS